jgi:hypothetical protein
MPYASLKDLDDMDFLSFGFRGTAVEAGNGEADHVQVWNSATSGWSTMYVYDNKYYLASNATSTTLPLDDASEFNTGWTICVMNGDYAEWVQIQSKNGNTLTVTTMTHYSSYTTANNTFLYKFDPTRYALTTSYTGGTTLYVGANNYFEAGDEVFITDENESDLEWGVIDSISSDGTTIMLEAAFSSSYLTGNGAYIHSRPKFGRWRYLKDGSGNDPWAKSIEGLTDVKPDKGFMIKCNKDPRRRFVVHRKSVGGN